MWAHTFPERLTAWAQLRTQAAALPPAQALAAINSWWFQTPWRPYHLHWDDVKTWPDPWQLLDDNVYCGLEDILSDVIEEAICGCGIEDVCVDVHGCLDLFFLLV